MALESDLMQVDQERLFGWRMGRLQREMQREDVDLLMLVSPISLRYAIGYRNYALFQSHIPTTYLFLFQDASPVLFNAYQQATPGIECRVGRAISFFDGGDSLDWYADKLVGDMLESLVSAGCSGRKVAIEYVNPSVTLAANNKELEVIDGVRISERARTIKNVDEIHCIRHAMAVAERGAAAISDALQPGVSELELWALLNYTNCVNDGDWHDGRALVSGPRINPWYQEASPRKLASGDLLGFDTDMIGPNGYFADLSRTLHCGPKAPTKRQKQLYQLAYAEIEHNLNLVRPGMTFQEFQELAYPVEEEFHENAYTCLLHGVGMTDEYPRINPGFRGENPYEGELEVGMVVCVESYMGAVGESNGVKLEQQVVVTENGYDLITQFPFEEKLLG